MCWRSRRACGIVCGGCDDALCATRPWRVCDVCWRLEIVLYMLATLEGMRRRLLFTLEGVEGGLCLLEVSEVSEVLDVLEVMRRMLLFTLEAVDGGLC